MPPTATTMSTSRPSRTALSIGVSVVSVARAITSDRRWRFDAPVEVVWAAMADTAGFQQRWPWLERFDGRGLMTGDRWHATVRSPMPYRVRVSISIDAIAEHERIDASVHGDVTGTACITVRAAAAAATDVRLVSELTARRPLLVVLTRLAGPVARRGHDWVLDRGGDQFGADVVAGSTP